MPREARVCDMHRAGTWTGSESFILVVRIEKFLLGFTSELNIPIGSAAYKSHIGLPAWTAVQLPNPIALR